MRWKLFYKIVGRWVPEGSILPGWAVVLRWVMFPLDSAYWAIGSKTGYQGSDDTWLINGVRYSGEAMWLLSKAEGQTYKITRTGDVVTLEQVHNS